MLSPVEPTPQGSNLTTDLQQIQTDTERLKKHINIQTQRLILKQAPLILNPSTPTIEDARTYLAAESNRLKEKFKQISLTCTALDPKTIAQMREIALELERDAIAIQGFEELKTKPKVWIELQPLKRTASHLTMIDAVQANLGRFGRFKVRRQTRGLGFNTLLNKINRSTEQLHQNIKRSPPVETPDQRIEKFKTQIVAFEQQLADIQVKATVLNRHWDSQMRSTYDSKILNVKGKIQMLQWEQEAFLKVFNPETQKVLDFEAGIHTVLKKVNPENSGFKISDALRNYKKAEEWLAKIPKDSNAYVVAKQSLKGAKAEIDATVEKYKIPKTEQQRIAVELTKANPSIREGRFRSDLPVVAQVLSQKIQAIRLETNAEVRTGLIHEFEHTLKQLESKKAKLLEVKEFIPVIQSYQDDYAGEIAVATTPPHPLVTSASEFTEQAPRFIQTMRELKALQTDNIFRQQAPYGLKVLHDNGLKAMSENQSVKPETNVHVVGQSFKDLLTFMVPPLLSINDLNEIIEKDAQQIFELIKKNHSPELTTQLRALLSFLNEVSSATNMTSQALSDMWGSSFFGGPALMDIPKREQMGQVVLKLMKHVQPQAADAE